MSDIVIFIRGGVYHGAASDMAGNRIMVVDYDDEAAMLDSQRSFEPVKVDINSFEQAINGLGST